MPGELTALREPDDDAVWLHADISALERLLSDRTEADDPSGYRQYHERLRTQRVRLAALDTEPQR